MVVGGGGAALRRDLRLGTVTRVVDQTIDLWSNWGWVGGGKGEDKAEGG